MSLSPEPRDERHVSLPPSYHISRVWSLVHVHIHTHTERHIFIYLIFYIVFICRVLICEDGWLMSCRSVSSNFVKGESKAG